MNAGGVGVLGGTFDPIHIGHLIAADEVAYRLGLSHVLFVPNRQPPHKSGPTAPTNDRVEMVKIAIASIRAFRLDLTEVERPEPSYAVDTLRVLNVKYRTERLRFIVGLDAFLTLASWHAPDTILDEFSMVVMDRPAGGQDIEQAWKLLRARFPAIDQRVQMVQVPQISVSSSEIRRRVALGEPIRYLVPDGVEGYIRSHGLYGAG